MRQLKTRITRGIASINRDVKGNIMPMAAIGMIALAGMIGGGVDVSRGYMAQNRMQNACDAGVLAGRRAVGSNGYDTAAQAEADTFFETNFDAGNQAVKGLDFVTTTPDAGNTIQGVATASMDTVIMRIFGFASIPIRATCDASMSIGNSDVVMVLDVTGSMSSNLDGQSRMSALQDAMKSFYDTTSMAAAGGNGRIRYGFVPYSSSVNVGKLIYDESPSYLVDNWTYNSREPRTETQTATTYEAPIYSSVVEYDAIYNASWYYSGNTNYNSSQSCENALPADTDWANYGGETEIDRSYSNADGDRITDKGKRQDTRYRQYTCFYSNDNSAHRQITRYRYRYVDTIERQTERATTTDTETFIGWTYKPISFPTGVYKTFSAASTMTGPGGSSKSSTWDGCIEERGTVNAAPSSILYDTAADAILPAGTNDLDIDLIPTSDITTKWAPAWADISYTRRNPDGGLTSTNNTFDGQAASYVCPYKAQLLSEMNENDFDAYADSLTPSGTTYHDIGMIWGARLSSPESIFADNVNESPANNGAVSRHLVFMTDGFMNAVTNRYTSYGIEYHDKRVTNNGSSQQDARHIARFRAICEATKAKGIRIWVIAFASELTTDLERCASPNSSFPASNASQLNDAFQSIGQAVGELRIVQ